MTSPDRHPLISGARVTALGTLVSRVLGMARDIATASLFGLSSGGVMDAFAVALRVPNLFRRLFAEGALAASFLPVFTGLLESDRRRAWQLASVTMIWLAVFLTVLLLAAEGVCGLIWLVWGDVEGMGLLLGLTATMLPYMVWICLAAQVAAMLHTLSHFATSALAPALLNICWLVAVLAIAPRFAPNQHAQAYVLAASVVIAGVLQWGMQFWVLRSKGFRFDYNWSAGRDSLFKIIHAMGPMVLGLAVTQVNTLLDSLIAWGLAAAPDGPQQIAWLGSAVAYPMRQGAAASVYYGERLYQFPLGVLGIAVATAIFPLLSRHAARGDRKSLAGDLTLGIRLVLLLGIPAGVGLIVLARPLAELLFEHGRFTAEDTARTASMIACYAAGVWAYCALPVIVRGYYALGDRLTPVRVGMAAVVLNLSLNLTLIWPLAEKGLALATAISASVQIVMLIVIFSRYKSPLDWTAIAITLLRTLTATLLMAAAGVATLWAILPGESLWIEIVRVGVPFTVAVGTFMGVYWCCGGGELKTLLGGRTRNS